MEASVSKRRRQDNMERTRGVIFTLSVPSKLQVGSNALLSLFDQVPKSSKIDSDVEDGELTVTDQITKELQALKKDSKSYRFSSELSRGVGLIAFKDSISPTQFIHTFLTNHCPPISPAFVSRIIPIEIVCAPNIASFTSLCLPKISKQFKAYQTDRSWKLVFDKHALTNLSKDNVLESLYTVIEDRHEASITSPDLVLMVQIFQSMCGVSILEDFEDLAEYNVRKLVSRRSPIDDN